MDRPTPPPGAGTPPGPDAAAAVGRAWHEHRRHLLDIAGRMLGDRAEAEDVVQEAYARLVRLGPDELARVDDVGGWLVVVTSRLCLDRLRAGRRHPTTTDDALLGGGPQAVGDVGAPGAATVDPADRVTLDDSVRGALDRVLARLSPAERTAFVLHDVFQFPFEAVAEMVGRSPAACRQLASRARRAVRSDVAPDRFSVAPADQRRVLDRFLAACAAGDLDGLLAVLDPDVDGVADVGGPVGRRVAAGAVTVAALLVRYLGPATGTALLALPGPADEAVLVGRREGEVVLLAILRIRAGRIVHFEGIADPVVLAWIAASLTGPAGRAT
jgi:RNA polymerase sigma-70 factor (ECF subfamily)